MSGQTHYTQCNPPAPEGWTLFGIRGGFMDQNGPLYSRQEDGRFVLGMRIEERHCNPRHVGHGGWLMTFADMVMPMAAHHHPQIGRKFLPTISLTTDFLAPAPLGSWLTGRTNVLRVTRNMVFAHGLISADDNLIARVNGIFKIGEPLSKFIGDADV